jgi:hypothetical protein
MPHLQISSSNLLTHGPTIRITVEAPASLSEATTVETPALKPLELEALIDTGAARTCFKTGALAALTLPPIDEAPIMTAGSRAWALRYSVRIGIAAVGHFADLTVLELPMEGIRVDCLIGRDLLSQAVLIYQGFGNSFTLSF